MNADKWTDQELIRIEKEIDSIYKKANEDLMKKSKDYFDQFKKDDEVFKKAVESGDMSKSTYYRWRKKTLTQGNQYKDLQKQTAFEITRANERATAYVNGRLPQVYVQNYNAVKTDVDGIGGYSFTLVNEDAVKYVYQNIDKNLLPFKQIDKAKDVAWNMKKINSEVLQGIIQGESMDKVAGRLQNAGIASEKAAIRNARTMVTGAQNHGKLDSYYRLKDDGIDIKKRWDATLDKRTREAHGELDGQTAEIDEPFENSIGKIMYPGDPDADPANVYNCRCSLQGDVGQTRGTQRATRDENGKSVLTENMTYQEWYESRTGKRFEVGRASTQTKTIAPQSLKDRIDGVRRKIQESGGEIKEEHLHEAGKYVADDFDSMYKERMKQNKERVDELEKEIEPLKIKQQELVSKRGEVYKDYLNGNASIADYRKSVDELTDLNRRMAVLEAERKNLITVPQEEAEKWMKNKLSEVRSVGAKDIDLTAHLSHSRSAVRKNVEHAYDGYPTDWIQKSVDEGLMTVKKVQRGYFARTEIALSGYDQNSLNETAFHELGHRFEWVKPEIRKAEKEFYERRTSGESLKWLGSGYGRKEVTREDEFLHPYMGKYYGDTFYELVSMGFQYAYTNPTMLAKDPDMQSWIYGILTLL